MRHKPIAIGADLFCQCVPFFAGVGQMERIEAATVTLIPVSLHNRLEPVGGKLCQLIQGVAQALPNQFIPVELADGG